MKKLAAAILATLATVACAQQYKYGYPSGGKKEPDVKAQFTFEEYSAPIYNMVTGTAFSAWNTPVFRVDTSGYSKHMDYGIKLDIPGVQDCFYKDGADADFDIGTGDATIEFVYEAYYDLAANGGTGGTVIDTRSLAGDRGWMLSYAGGTTTIEITLWAEDGSVAQPRFTNMVPSPWTVGQHKIRLVLDRDVGARLWVDGVEQMNKTNWTLSTILGKEVKAKNVYIGCRNNKNFVLPVIYNELRLSGNATNKSKGIGD